MIQEKSLVKQNILRYLDHRGITAYEFYKRSGTTRGILAQNNGISEDNIAKFLAFAPEVNTSWLLTGDGPMINPDYAGETAPDSDRNAVPQGVRRTHKYSGYAIPFANTQNVKPIPLVLQTVAAGFGNNNFMISESDVKEFYVVPKFRYCHVDFMIEVSGVSMMPHLMPGDIIACSIIRDSQFIQWNKCHVIATREQGLLVKRLLKSDKENFIQAISDNKDYPPIDIPKDEITGLALVVGSIGLE
ncbi:MAG: LexA family transcriptional regulator [Bacteroidaceae bacterium]|nr:LexA family transcriptional regulator [Bacteroidaceae bacterium]